MSTNGDGRWVEPRMPELARLGRIDLETLCCELWHLVTSAAVTEGAPPGLRECVDGISARYYRAWEEVARCSD